MKVVLIVDDEFSIVETLGEVVAWHGYGVASAFHGEEALELVRRDRPALILLDYMMPVMDGLQMLARLRADPELRTTPVIMMTAAPLGLPAVDHHWQVLLRKPFDVDQLMEAIERLIGPGEPRSDA